MNRASLLVFAFILIRFVVNAQIVTPVRWACKAAPRGQGEYKLIFTARIAKGWHICSQDIGEGGPMPTRVTFDSKNKDVELVGKITETSPKTHEEHDPIFNMQLKYYETELVCTQTIKVLKDTKLKGTIEFMACSEKVCVPPDDKDFEFKLSK